MVYLKRIARSFIVSFTTFLISLLFFTLLCYLNILKGKGITIINLIVPIISIFAGSFNFCKKHGWLEGLIYGFIILIIILLTNIFIYKGFIPRTLIYYLILLFSSMLGGMIGINKKKNIATN